MGKLQSFAMCAWPVQVCQTTFVMQRFACRLKLLQPMREGGLFLLSLFLTQGVQLLSQYFTHCSSSISIAAHCSNQCHVAERAVWLALDQQSCFHARGSDLFERHDTQRIIYIKNSKDFNKHIKHTAHKANFQPQYHNCTGSIALAVQGIRFIADYVYITDFVYAGC